MSTLKAKDIEIGLQRKGFVKDDKRDHKYFIYYDDGMKTAVRTKLSHGKNEIGSALIAAMARQTKLTKEQFVELIQCPLSADEYSAILKTQGGI